MMSFRSPTSLAPVDHESPAAEQLVVPLSRIDCESGQLDLQRSHSGSLTGVIRIVGQRQRVLAVEVRPTRI
jgi:hypothetical protein